MIDIFMLKFYQFKQFLTFLACLATVFSLVRSSQYIFRLQYIIGGFMAENDNKQLLHPLLTDPKSLIAEYRKRFKIYNFKSVSQKNLEKYINTFHH